MRQSWLIYIGFYLEFDIKKIGRYSNSQKDIVTGYIIYIRRKTRANTEKLQN